MKRIISILVAMLMLLTMVPAFAASEVNTSSPSLAYLNTFAGVADAKGTITTTGSPDAVSGSNITFSKYNPAGYEFKNEQLIVTQTPENTTNALTYLYFSKSQNIAIEDDVYAIGLDVKFSGITSNTQNVVLHMNPGREPLAWNDIAQMKLDKDEWFVHTDGNAYAYTYDEDGAKVYENGKPVPNGKAQANKTAWCFKNSGDDFAFVTKAADEGLKLASNGQPAIYLGSAELLQDTFYTLKIYVNNNTRKYYAVIIDESGNVLETGVDGTIQKAFANTTAVKGEILLNKSLNAESSVTYDNIFFDKLDFAVNVADFQPNAEGTVSLSAAIPDNVVNPALYINDTFVENITVVPGKTDYNITAALPEGTLLGNVKFEIRGTIDGAAASSTTTAKYFRGYERPISISWNKTPITVDGETYYDAIETRGSTGNQTDGLYRIDFKFKPRSATTNLNARFVSNVVGAEAITALFEGSGNYKVWDIRNGSFANANVSTTEWNTASLIVDYRGDTINKKRPYYFTINGVTHVGEMWLNRQATMNGFYQFALNAVYFKDATINEIVQIEASDIVATYEGGNTAAYEGAALISPGMKSLSFAFTGTPDSASAFSFVDESGAVVANTTLSVSGKNVVVTPAAGTVIPSGNYKLVADKTASFAGNVLGVGLEVPVALYAPASIFAPVEGETVGTTFGATNGNDSTEITFFAPDANKVEVYVNDAKVKTFAAPSENGVYSFAYTPEKVGKNYIDVYSYTANGIELASSTFNYEPYGAFNIYGERSTQGLSSVSATGPDGGAGHTYTTNIQSGNRFVNYSNFKSDFGTAGGQRIGVREFDIKVNDDNTQVSLEVGISPLNNALTSGNSTITKADGSTVSVANYPNYADLPGTGELFAKSGKINRSNYTWEVGEWYHVKSIFDFENKVFSLYVSNDKLGKDVLIGTKDMSSHGSVVNTPDTVVNRLKYRIHITQIDATGTNTASATIANVKIYELKKLPAASVAEETITAGTDSVAVALDKAYISLAASDITVNANGAEVEGAAAAISEDGKTITVSGLAAIPAGTKVEIGISENAAMAKAIAAPAGKAGLATIFVADSNNVCLLPLKVQSEDGTNLSAYSKYINGSGDALSTYFIMTEYEDEAAGRVKQTNFSPVSVEAGSVGIVSGYLTGVVKAQGCQVMLWNTDFAPLLEAGTISE